MEVLDSVAHSVHVKPENLRLAEVRVLQLGSKPWAALVGTLVPTALQGIWPLTVACHMPHIHGTDFVMGGSVLHRVLPSGALLGGLGHRRRARGVHPPLVGW